METRVVVAKPGVKTMAGPTSISFWGQTGDGAPPWNSIIDWGSQSIQSNRTPCWHTPPPTP